MTAPASQVAPPLAAFIEERALPGTGIDADAFWRGVADIFARFAPENRALLAERDALQAQIDAWHDARAGKPIDPAAYQAFLREIGYLVAEPAPFAIDDRRMSTPRSRRWPGRSSSCRCSTRASCSTPPMRAGAASTTRSTAPTRCPARPGRAAMTPSAARR